MRTDDELLIAHLYRRAGFGISRAGLAKATKKGFDACVDELLHPEKVDDPLEQTLGDIEGELFDLTVLEDAQAWWLYRMIKTRRPLLEKLTLFWHGHFATGATKVDKPQLLVRQNRTLRAHAFGSFADLLTAVSKDPAMLVWLDNGVSTKKKPNENYGRELLELFTLGVGHYNEEDVRAVARAFTGWKQRDGEFAFDAKDHDNDPKTLFGETWNWSGEEVVAVLARHPATAARLAQQLVKFFAHDDGHAELESALARRYLETGGDIRAVLATLFRSPHFVSDDARRSKVKSPCEFVVGAIRELDATVPMRALPAMLGRMGQAILNPPDVSGWDGGISWINSSTLFERANFANFLATQRGVSGDGRFEPAQWLAQDASGVRAVEIFVDTLLDGRAGPTMNAALAEYLTGKDKEGKVTPFKVTPQVVDEKVRGLVRLILSSPEYQLA